MFVKLLVLSWLICGYCVLSKPTEGIQPQDQDQNSIVNMEVNQNQANGKQPPKTHTNNPDVTGTSQRNEDVIQTPAHGQTNDDRQITDNQPANEHVSESVDHQQLKDNSQVADAETANEQRGHIPRQQENTDIDWGHGGVTEIPVVNADLHTLQQHNQQQAEQQQQQQQPKQQQKQEQQQHQPDHQQQQQPHQQQSEQHQQEQQQEQQEPQQPHQPAAQETAQSINEQHVQEARGQHGDAHHDVGVQEPEQLLHGDDVHDAHHGEVNETSKEETEAEKNLQSELKFQSEQKEIQDIQPNIETNVHDGKARTAAEFMKDKQFGPVDVEEALHGGHHVHEGQQEGSHAEAQAGDAEMIAQGEDAHTDHEDDSVPLSIDPDEMMHAGQGEGHVHSDHQQQEKQTDPNAETPDDALPPGQQKAERVKGPIGTDVENVVHDGHHVHQKMPADYKPRNKVKYQDIIDLGLSQELLKGIDLSKLLEQEKKDMEDFHRETNANKDEDAEDINDTERSAQFWKKVTDLRKVYLEKLYAKVRHISNPDPENAEWEEDDDQVRGLRDPSKQHEGESKVEHEMEMWASTIAKGNRKPYKVLQEKWETKGEGQKEEEKPEVVLLEKGLEQNHVQERADGEEVRAEEEHVKQNEEQNKEDGYTNEDEEHPEGQEYEPIETEQTEDLKVTDL